MRNLFERELLSVKSRVRLPGGEHFFAASVLKACYLWRRVADWFLLAWMDCYGPEACCGRLHMLLNNFGNAAQPTESSSGEWADLPIVLSFATHPLPSTISVAHDTPCDPSYTATDTPYKSCFHPNIRSALLVSKNDLRGFPSHHDLSTRFTLPGQYCSNSSSAPIWTSFDRCAG